MKQDGMMCYTAMLRMMLGCTVTIGALARVFVHRVCCCVLQPAGWRDGGSARLALLQGAKALAAVLLAHGPLMMWAVWLWKKGREGRPCMVLLVYGVACAWWLLHPCPCKVCC